MEEETVFISTELQDKNKEIYDKIQGWKAVLKNIYFLARKGEITVVIGDTGAGKSSLLYAILGEMHHEK